MPTKPPLELISFAMCPFVQRSEITLLEKQVDFKLTLIDLGNKPDWFLAISPRGKVPVLRVGDEVLFESAVINEYLDETHPPPLHPPDPLQRARHRAWIEFGSALLWDLYAMMLANDERSFERAHESLSRGLERVEGAVSGQGFFGDTFSLVDAAYAPLFQRLEMLKAHGGPDLLDNLPRTRSWSTSMIQRESVRQATPDNFEKELLSHLEEGMGYLYQQLMTRGS